MSKTAEIIQLFPSFQIHAHEPLYGNISQLPDL